MRGKSLLFNKIYIICTCNVQQPFRIPRERCVRCRGYCELFVQQLCHRIRVQYSVAREKKKSIRKIYIYLSKWIRSKIKIYIDSTVQREEQRDRSRASLHTHTHTPRSSSFAPYSFGMRVRANKSGRGDMSKS